MTDRKTRDIVVTDDKKRRNKKKRAQKKPGAGDVPDTLPETSIPTPPASGDIDVDDREDFETEYHHGGRRKQPAPEKGE